MGDDVEQGGRVVIIGHNTLLNELLATSIREKLALTCELHTEVDRAIGRGLDISDPWLLLVDDADQKARGALLDRLRDGGLFRQRRVIPALFNVDPESAQACLAARRGVAGLLLQTLSPAETLEGVKALLRGERWIPKEIMIQPVTDTGWDAEPAVKLSGLTRREMEVLSLVRTGATNEQIAGKLCISPNTVKTHLYNIFRKIGAKNRFRAALWVTQNIGVQPPDAEPAGFAVAAAQ